MNALRIFRSIWMVWAGIIFLLPLLGGCQNDELPDEIRTVDEAYKAIVGNWEWKKSLVINRRQGNTLVQTPKSEGITKQYVFQRNKSMQYIENGSILWKSEYEIEVNETKLRLQILETGFSTGISFNSDTLVFINRVFGDNEFYIRK
ncbi:MAG: hypothetical protein JJU34_09200 [Lunatimonas sp.]|uniref:hypothetical protein n=1 Tax=Lunatimonas sp. TaxID=2060141 RepID=UPI00263AEDF8|nr:hypothetical protein [Lunatimonas sp.]MCC5937446.1 hypothetical protein [Lunatimonas sp.]